MGFLSTLLLTVAATADSFTIGFNYGVKNVRIGNVSNLFISLVCLVGTFAAMLAGKLLGGAVPPYTANLLGAFTLCAFGSCMLVKALLPERKPGLTEDPAAVDKDGSQIIELRESVMIGLLLSLNNIGLGVGAGIAGVPVYGAPALCAAMSFLFIKAGHRLGGRFSGKSVSKPLEALSALFVLALGAIGLL